MAFYETVFLVRQDVSATQVEALAKEFSDIVSKNGGKVERQELWGLRTLAYLVNKNRKAHYVMFQISGEGSTILELERQFRINEDVVRYMTVKIDALSKEPSVMMNKDKGDRPERNDRFDRFDRGDRPERSGRNDRYDRSDRNERFDRSDRSDKSDRVA